MVKSGEDEKFSCVLKQRPDYDYKPTIYCRCGEKTPRWISWTVKNPGLRFNKCKRGSAEGGCGFYQFFDAPFPDRPSAIIRGLCVSEKEKADRIEKLEAEIRELRSRQMVFNGVVDEMLCLKDENQKMSTLIWKLKFCLGLFILVVFVHSMIKFGMMYHRWNDVGYVCRNRALPNLF